ncbi:MAG: hypothetical protein QXG40_01800 [Ignisphaera sp.]
MARIAIDIESITSAISRYIGSRAPNLIKSLNTVCLKLYSRSCIELLIYEPQKLRDTLLHYNDTTTTKFIIKYLFLQPIIEENSGETPLDRLATLFIDDAERFREELWKILQKRKTQPSNSNKRKQQEQACLHQIHSSN